MRTKITLGMLSLPLVLSACGRSEDGIAGSSAKAAALPPSYAELTPAPQGAQRMRFVSDIERARTRSTTAPARTATAHNMAMADAPVARDPLSAMAAMKPATVLTASAHAEPTLIAPVAAAAEAPAHGARADLQQMATIDHAGEMPRDPVPLGQPFNVVIRGGVPGRDKCDPRVLGTAADPARAAEIPSTTHGNGRPNLSMPLVPQSRGFSGGFRR